MPLERIMRGPYTCHSQVPQDTSVGFSIVNQETPIVKTKFSKSTVGVEHIGRSDETAAVETAHVGVTAIMWKWVEVNLVHALNCVYLLLL